MHAELEGRVTEECWLTVPIANLKERAGRRSKCRSDIVSCGDTRRDRNAGIGGNEKFLLIQSL